MTNDQTVTQALEPCPAGHDRAALDYDDEFETFFVRCEEPDCSWQAWGDTKAEAITAWNTRTAHSGEGRSNDDVQCCGEYVAGSRCPACPDRAAYAGEVERLRKALAAIAREVEVANDVIRLERDLSGSGRVKVATAVHRIREWSRAALAQPEAGGER